jgi:hypothetical protein
VLLFKFILDNIIRGFILALTLAAALFFVNGEHIGEPVFFAWMFFGFLASLFLKFLEAVEIYQKLKNREL